MSNYLLSSNKPSLAARIIYTLLAVVVALIVGALISTFLTILLFRYDEHPGVLSMIAITAAAIIMFSYMVAYRIYCPRKWPQKQMAVVTGLSLLVVLVAIIIISLLAKYPLFMIALVLNETIVASMLTYTVAHLLFRRSGLPQIGWVNWLCLALTFLWCFVWCTFVSLLFYYPD